MKCINKISVILICICATITMSANQTYSKIFLIDKYYNQLKHQTNSRDSLKILYNLFDLSDRKDQGELAWQIYYTAGRAENINAQIDMIRNLSVLFGKNDSIVALLQKLTDKIPNNDARESTKTFILNQHLNFKAQKPEDEKLSAMLLDSIVNSHDFRGDNIYDKLAILYQIIQYIGVDAEGSLFTECFEKYGELLEQLPESDYPLKNQFYTTGAIFYSRINGDQRKAVEYDEKLLDIMDDLEKVYKKQERIHRNYDTNRFNCYRRILSNFKVLSPKEVETAYDSVMALYNRNPDVKQNLDKYQRSHAYYHYAKGEYKDALPYIKAALEADNLSIYNRIKLLDMLIKSAKAVGDQRTYVKAMEEYIECEDLVDSMRSVANNREIMIRNSIFNIPLLNDETSMEMPQKSRNRDITMMVISSLLAAMLLIYMVLYMRLRRKRR